jgi:hypothetical protein
MAALERSIIMAINRILRLKTKRKQRILPLDHHRGYRYRLHMAPTEKTTDQDKNKASPKGAPMGKKQAQRGNTKQAQRADALRANLLKRKQQARARTTPETAAKEKN